MKDLSEPGFMRVMGLIEKYYSKNLNPINLFNLPKSWFRKIVAGS